MLFRFSLPFWWFNMRQIDYSSHHFYAQLRTSAVFSRGRLCFKLSFIYGDESMLIVNDFMHLRVVFSKTGSFVIAKKAQYRNGYQSYINNVCKGRLQLDLFDKIIRSIFLIGREVRGTDNNTIIQRVHLKFCWILLNAKSNQGNQDSSGDQKNVIKGHSL